MTFGKKLISLLLAAIMLTSGFACLTFTGSAVYDTGDTFTFGSYPQTKVTDESLISALNSRSGNWISLGLYSGNGSWNSAFQRDYTKYCDITLNGVKYRGIKFSEYRPDKTTIETSTAANPGVLYPQYNNGYRISTAYWFKYEPIKWRVLDPSTGLVICQSIIDSQAFNNQVNFTGNKYYNRNDSTEYFACDYTHSSIRNWLNGTFLSTAFTTAEQAKITASTISNTGYYTLIGNGNYTDFDFADTGDRIFLPSYDELLDTEKGYKKNAADKDPLRVRKGSDFAECMGLHVYSDGNASWRLRTAGINTVDTCIVNNYGQSTRKNKIDANITYFGIVPMLCCSDVKPSAPATVTVTFNPNGGSVSQTSKSVTVGGLYGTLPTPTREGYTFQGWYDGATRVTATTTVTKTSAHTLTAGWLPSGANVTVTFAPNGGSVSQMTKSVTVGSAYGALPNPTRTGYVFLGWYDGSTKIDETTTVTKTSDHTLTAKWQGSEITVTFDPNGGTVSTTSKKVRVGDTYGSLPTPTRSDYTFLGWYTVNVGGTIINASSTVTSPISHKLFAHWQEKSLIPTVAIVNYRETLSTDYKATVTISAQTANAPSGSEIHWFIDGKDSSTGTSYTQTKAKKSFTVQAKLMLKGVELASSPIENVQVKTGFFAKLQAFFRGIFGKLPKIVQGYFVADAIDNILK